MEADAPLLEVRGLRKAYGTTEVLKGVDLELYPGEVLGVVGASGSGKSTTLKMINRLRLPGLEGVNLLALDPYAKARVRCHLALVHQEASAVLRMGFSALTNVVEPLLLEGQRTFSALRERGLEALARVDFPLDRVLYPPRWLSGGQRQRVQLARALAQGAAILLLDEPTTGLDLLVQATFLDSVRRLKAQGRFAMVLVSHDLGVVRAVSDRILVLLEGRVVEEGLADQVLEDPQHPYTQDLVQARL